MAVQWSNFHSARRKSRFHSSPQKLVHIPNFDRILQKIHILSMGVSLQPLGPPLCTQILNVSLLINFPLRNWLYTILKEKFQKYAISAIGAVLRPPGPLFRGPLAPPSPNLKCSGLVLNSTSDPEISLCENARNFEANIVEMCMLGFKTVFFAGARAS